MGVAGGLAATMVITNMTARAYMQATLDHITVAHLLVGLVKTPFLALAIGLRSSSCFWVFAICPVVRKNYVAPRFTSSLQ